MFASLVARAQSCELEPDVPLQITEGVVYSQVRGTPLLFDMARPADRQRRPAVIVIHGGGWAAATRAITRRQMEVFASNGYVAVNIDYRLARPPRNTFPAAVSDVRCAVRHVRAHADRYGIDPEHIAAVGFSAGGHLAALLAFGANVPDLDDGTCALEGEPRISGAVAYYAPFDLRGPHDARWDRIVSDFLGAPALQVPERAALASPIVHASAGDAPLFMVHGTEDPIVDIADARAMLATLRSTGVDGDLLEVPGARHGFVFVGARYRAAACATLAVLHRWLRGN